MLLLELSQLFFPAGQIGFGGGGILFRRHVVKNYDVSLLQMETVQVVESVFGLT